MVDGCSGRIDDCCGACIMCQANSCSHAVHYRQSRLWHCTVRAAFCFRCIQPVSFFVNLLSAVTFRCRVSLSVVATMCHELSLLWLSSNDVVCLYRPRLGNSLHHVLVGIVYLVLGSFEGIRRVITVITVVICYLPNHRVMFISALLYFCPFLFVLFCI